MAVQKKTLKKMVAAAVAFPVIVFFALDGIVPTQTVVDVPVHAILETAGLTIGLIAALVFLSPHRKTPEYPEAVDWIAIALIAMGIIDGFHSAVPPGTTAIWLHAMAVLSGGILFTGIWWGRSVKERKHRYLLAGIVAIYALILGIITAVSPGIVPYGTQNAVFLLVADGINLTGAFLFALAAAGLYSLGSRTGSQGFAVFCVFCIFNSLAALFSPITLAWTAAWWFWHILRLGAYLIVLVFLYERIIVSRQ